MVRVVISRLTRVPGLSLSNGKLGRKDTRYRGPEEALTMTSGMLNPCVNKNSWRNVNAYIFHRQAASTLRR